MAQRSKEKQATSGDLCKQAFSRCSNWPDAEGQLGLAAGLKIAAHRYALMEEEIVAKCRETSVYCPTDSDLLRVAHELDADRKRRTAGTPPWMRQAKCFICGDSGWAPITGRLYDSVQRCPNGCEIPDQARFGGGA